MAPEQGSLHLSVIFLNTSQQNIALNKIKPYFKNITHTTRTPNVIILQWQTVY